MISLAPIQGLLVGAILLTAAPPSRRAERDPVRTCGFAFLRIESAFTEGALALGPILCRNPERFTVMAAELLATINPRISSFNETYAGRPCDPDVRLPLPARNTADVMLALQENLGVIPTDRFCNGVDDPDSVCGNDVEDPGETCDGADLGGQTCETLGNGVGTLSCSPDCQGFDLTGCGGVPYCGNGTLDPGEACDQGGETSTCDADCTSPACSDGLVNSSAGEECDGGVATAACDADCTIAFCGDARLNTLRGEFCDTGATTVTCDGDCTPVQCGDGFVNSRAGEQCDSAGLATATCDADCTIAYCGDGTVNIAHGESCDAGITTATCDGDCTPVQCGDGVVNSPGGEQCDSGGEAVAACDADCTIAYCGDATVNATRGEECDGGSTTATCDDDCTAPVCGDGIQNYLAGEQCDDHNEQNGDGCSSACQIEP